MGFHRRHISNEWVVQEYQTLGINGIKKLYETDAVVSEIGLASDVVDKVLNNKHTPKLWISVAEMIEKYIK